MHLFDRYKIIEKYYSRNENPEDWISFSSYCLIVVLSLTIFTIAVNIPITYSEVRDNVFSLFMFAIFAISTLTSPFKLITLLFASRNKSAKEVDMEIPELSIVLSDILTLSVSVAYYLFNDEINSFFVTFVISFFAYLLFVVLVLTIFENKLKKKNETSNLLHDIIDKLKHSTHTQLIKDLRELASVSEQIETNQYDFDKQFIQTIKSMLESDKVYYYTLLEFINIREVSKSDKEKLLKTDGRKLVNAIHQSNTEIQELLKQIKVNQQIENKINAASILKTIPDK